jgi:hypothetical protein
MDIIPKNDSCNLLFDKYSDLIFTEEQTNTLNDNINFYYNAKAKHIKQKNKKCVICGKSPGSTFVEKYNEADYIRSLHIYCNNDKPCQGWNTSYGVIFDLQNITQNEKKYIDNLKQMIIINKNDMMFGYKSEKEAIELHDTLIKQLENITDTYANKLYKYLYFSRNEQMNKDIAKIKNHIEDLKKEISINVIGQDYNTAVVNCLKIKDDMKCILKYKELEKIGTGEYLFNINSELVTEEHKEKKKRDTNRKNKKIEEREVEKETEQEEKEKSSSKSDAKHKKEIEKELKHLFDTFEIIEELLQVDQDYLEQVEKELTHLKKKIKKHGTEDQKSQFELLNNLYKERLDIVNAEKENKEEAERKSIKEALEGEQTEELQKQSAELKQQLESEMEELT